MAVLSYQVHIFNAGTTSFSTGNVEFSLSGPSLADPPIVHGSIVRAFEGRTEGRPWQVRVLDSSGSFTAQLAGGDGRLDQLNRWVQVRRTVDGAAAVIGSGRLSDVALGDVISSYDLTIESEPTFTRNALIFNTSNTTRIYPPGPHVNYGPFTAPPKGKVYVAAIATPTFPTSNSTPKMFWLHFLPGWIPLTDLGLQSIKSDLRSITYPNNALGNFTHLKMRIGASTYPVVSFGAVPSTVFQVKPDPNPLATLEDGFSESRPPKPWIVANSSSEFALGQTLSSAFLHMFSAPPSEATPLHIGTSAGMHPMTLKRQLLAGAYSSAGQSVFRYSTAAFNSGSSGLERIPMPLMRWRITSPARLGDWMEQELNAPCGVVDFLDSSGRIFPRRVWLPATTAAFSFEFTAAKLRDPHPSWLQPSREMVTEIQLNYTDEQWEVGGFAPSVVYSPINRSGVASDFIRATPKVEPLRHDRIGQLGVHPLPLHVSGVHPPVLPVVDFGNPYGPAYDPQFDNLKTTIRREIFERWGDGPILGTLYGLSTCDSVVGGDFARLTLNTFPNPGIGARGGTRNIQILSVSKTPWGPEFQYLDAGPNSNALAAPTIVLSLSTVSPKHLLKATIASIPTGAAFQLDIAESNTTAAPGSTSTLWTRINTSAVSTGTYLIGNRKAGGAYWGRVRASQQQRVRSAWQVSTGKVTTSGLTAPTIAAGNIKAQSLDLAITPGEPNYPLQVFADTSTSASFSASNLVRELPAGTKKFSLYGLNAGTKHLLGARHIEYYGGVSAADSTTATTLSTASTNYITCRAPNAFYLIFGST